jgi:hypothetical protein
MLNSIPTDQNIAANIALLKAQRQMYGIAKRVLAFEIALSLLGPLLSGIATLGGHPNLKVWAAFLGLVISLVDAGALEPWQSRLKTTAAKIQEMFDSSVLRMPWNTFKVGKTVPPEDVAAAAAALSKRAARRLKTWYPSAVGEVPLPVARLVCQRANLWWDASLRRRYRVAVLALCATLTLIILTVGLASDSSLANVVLGLAATSPLLLWSVREFVRQGTAIATEERLRDHAEDLIDRLVSRKISDEDLERESLALQGEIYDRRRTNAVIFDWVYWILQSMFESQMRAGADALVLRYQNGVTSI